MSRSIATPASQKCRRVVEMQKKVIMIESGLWSFSIFTLRVVRAWSAGLGDVVDELYNFAIDSVVFLVWNFEFLVFTAVRRARLVETGELTTAKVINEKLVKPTNIESSWRANFSRSQNQKNLFMLETFGVVRKAHSTTCEFEVKLDTCCRAQA